MKIRKLKIKNYKIFDDVEFDFTDAEGKTLDTVVLAGVNGCGKTTVLEMISKFFNHDFTAEFDKSMVKIELEVTLTKSAWIRLHDVYNLEDLNLADTSFETRFIELDISHDGNRMLNNIFLQRFNQPDLFGVYIPIKFEKVQKPQYINSYIKICDINQHLKDSKQKSLKDARDEVFENKNNPPKSIIEKHINNLSGPLRGLTLNTQLVDLESEEWVFESANGQRIYFEQLSHGEQNLYFRAIYLSQMNLKDGIIMVDEPEVAFHPTWQQKIAQLYQNVGENNQVFMATHSPHIMASVPPESLFMLHIEEREGKRKIKVINAAKAGKHSQGLEPDRILKEIMQVETLRDYETQRDIDELSGLLTIESFESDRALELADNLTNRLGREDSFIILLEHELLMLRRKKRTLALATA